MQCLSVAVSQAPSAVSQIPEKAEAQTVFLFFFFFFFFFPELGSDSLSKHSQEQILSGDGSPSTPHPKTVPCGPGYPGTHSVNQADLKLRDLPASAS